MSESVIWYADIRDVGSISDLTSKSMLSAAECRRIAEFRFEEDQKRSLLSLLLQHSCIRSYLNPKKAALIYEIARVVEGKPFLKVASINYTPSSPRTDSIQHKLGTWNYNVSHHGHYVCIASHPHLLIGVDIVDLSTRSPKLASTANEYINMFTKVLHPREQQRLSQCASEEEKYTLFFIIWCLKESYIKAIGIGLGLDLKSMEFKIEYKIDVREKKLNNEKMTDNDGSEKKDVHYEEHSQQHCGTAIVYVDDEHCVDWFFEFFPLDSTHIMSVAVGPLNDASTSYKQGAWRHVDEEGMAEKVKECDVVLHKVRQEGIFSVLSRVIKQPLKALMKITENEKRKETGDDTAGNAEGRGPSKCVIV